LLYIELITTAPPKTTKKIHKQTNNNNNNKKHTHIKTNPHKTTTNTETLTKK
jgi:hypothetical protein